MIQTLLDLSLSVLHQVQCEFYPDLLTGKLRLSSQNVGKLLETCRNFDLVLYYVLGLAPF